METPQTAIGIVRKSTSAAVHILSGPAVTRPPGPDGANGASQDLLPP